MEQTVIYLVTVFYKDWDKGTETKTFIGDGSHDSEGRKAAFREFDLYFEDRENDGSDAIYLNEIHTLPNQTWMIRSWQRPKMTRELTHQERFDRLRGA